MQVSDYEEQRQDICWITAPPSEAAMYVFLFPLNRSAACHMLLGEQGALGGPHCSLQTLTGGCDEAEAGPFYHACSERDRENDLKLGQWRFRFSTRYFSFE